MARDGHTFSVALANPKGRPLGAVIVLQEIFGVTAHIRSVAQDLADNGYLAVAPALFDRARRDVQMGDSAEETQLGLGYRKQIPEDKTLLDIAACHATVRHAGRVAVVGFCWGGTLAWLSATRLPVQAAVCFYGSGIAQRLDPLPKQPVQMHFGESDQSIPMADVEAIRAAYPAGQVYTYAAGHAFYNDERPRVFNAAAAALARGRMLEFLAKALTA